MGLVQNPDNQNPDLSKSRHQNPDTKIPTYQNPDKIKIPTFHDPEIV